MSDESPFPVRRVPVREADLATIAALVNRAFLVHPIMRGERTSPDGLRFEAGEHGSFLLSEADASLVACAMIRPCHEELDRPETGIDYRAPLSGLYFGLAAVEPGLMRSGGGRTLLAEAERIARAEGRSHLVLTTLFEFGLPPYYERAGFSVVATEDFPPGHWWFDVPHRMAHMEKAL